MDLIKREMDLYYPKLIVDLTAKLGQLEYADALELWGLAHLAASQRRIARAPTKVDTRA